MKKIENYGKELNQYIENEWKYNKDNYFGGFRGLVNIAKQEYLGRIANQISEDIEKQTSAFAWSYSFGDDKGVVIELKKVTDDSIAKIVEIVNENIAGQPFTYEIEKADPRFSDDYKNIHLIPRNIEITSKETYESEMLLTKAEFEEKLKELGMVEYLRDEINENYDIYGEIMKKYKTTEVLPFWIQAKDAAHYYEALGENAPKDYKKRLTTIFE